MTLSIPAARAVIAGVSDADDALTAAKEANRNLSAEVARMHAVYLDIADSLLPNSSGPADLLAEIRRLQLREESNRNELACIYQMHSAAVDARDALRSALDEARAAVLKLDPYQTHVAEEVTDAWRALAAGGAG